MEKTSPKDVFLQLLSVIALYVSAGSFLTLLFQYVNIFFPDPLAGYYNAPYGAIRLAISTLVVVFPTYIWTMWLLNRSYLKVPEKRNLRIRKWLLYLTLFVAGMIMIGDVVTLVYSLLGGDLTVRFILKILSVLFVSGAVFIYYLWDIKKHKTE